MNDELNNYILFAHHSSFNNHHFILIGQQESLDFAPLLVETDD